MLCKMSTVYSEYKQKLQCKITVFYLNIFSNIIYSCDAKRNFSASLLQFSVSDDPS